MKTFPRIWRLQCLALAISLCALAFVPLARAEKVQDLKPTNFVNDFAGVIEPETRARLNALALEVQEKTHAQIAIVTIKSLENKPIEDFAVELFKAWGVGGKNDNRGVLILLSSGDRKYRVEVGYGLEPILPDGKVGGFGREMVPILKEGNYSAAIALLTTRTAQTIAQDANVELTGNLQIAHRRNDPAAPSLFSKLILYVVLFVVLIVVIRHPSILIWFLLSGGGGGRGGGGDWGGGGGGFGGGGDFGGFGGGSSGGGGASGSW